MPESFIQHYLRSLPAVDRVMQEKILTSIAAEVPRTLVVEAVQEIINEKREAMRRTAGEEELKNIDASPSNLALEVLERIRDKMELNLRPVLNASGVLLHTNLGRAPLAPEAVEAVKNTAVHFTNLEISLKTGRRASRYEHVEELLCRLTGAEAALVVNNNAAAVLLALNTMAAGREVIVSRGELVEIGGSFRVPEVMAQSGAVLVEVGTTNKCYLRDYRRAIGEQTALLLKVHTSNYKIVGFTASVESAPLAKLAGEHGLPVMEDLGSGVLIDLTRYGLPPEPRVQDSIAAGVDLVTFSGDKLLGGPQAGIIVGRKKYLQEMKDNHLLRALRVDKFTLSALEATLRLYLDEGEAARRIPVLRMLTGPVGPLQARAQKLAAELDKKLGRHYTVSVSGEKARVGGGSLPLVLLPSFQVVLESLQISAGELVQKLRKARPPVIARVKKDRVLLDLRTIREEEDGPLLETIVDALT